MATKTKSKKAKEVKKKAPVKKKSEKKPSLIAAEGVYSVIFSGGIPMTPEKTATANALGILRKIEMNKDEAIQYTILGSVKELRPKIYKTMIEAAVANNLRLIDVVIMMEIMLNEMSILGVWEYDNIDAANELLQTVTNATSASEMNQDTYELFKSLGGIPPGEEEEEGDVE